MSTGDDAVELLRLASADNFRDVTGPGYRATDGTPLRAGVLYRSNELALTHEDAATIAGLGVTDVFDLREREEVERNPDLPVPGATWEHLPVRGIPAGVTETLTDPGAAAAVVCGIYRSFVLDPDDRRSFGTLLRRLAHGTTPQLFHCTAGKDRTGWTAALVLTVAGVAPDVVRADYLRSNDLARGSRETYLRLVAEHLGEDRVPAFARLLAVEDAFLDSALAAADDAYGSLEGYLADGLGLTDDDRTALQARLRAPASSPPPTDDRPAWP